MLLERLHEFRGLRLLGVAQRVHGESELQAPELGREAPQLVVEQRQELRWHGVRQGGSAPWLHVVDALFQGASEVRWREAQATEGAQGEDQVLRREGT